MEVMEKSCFLGTYSVFPHLKTDPTKMKFEGSYSVCTEQF